MRQTIFRRARFPVNWVVCTVREFPEVAWKKKQSVIKIRKPPEAEVPTCSSSAPRESYFHLNLFLEFLKICPLCHTVVPSASTPRFVKWPQVIFRLGPENPTKQAAKKANAQTWLWKYLGYVLSKFDFFPTTTDVIILYGPCMGHDDGDSLPGKRTPH